MKNLNDPIISIIVPTKDSAGSLDVCLRSVNNQTYKNIEIIVVDCCSNDDTIKIAEKYHSKIYYYYPNMCSQRNLGVQKATGDYFIFLDSDIELSSKVVEECVEKTHEGYKVITFPEIIVGQGFWFKCREIEALCYLGDDTIEAPRFYEKDAFLELGGFDEELNGFGDWDLRERAIRAGYRIGRIKSLTMHYEGKINPINRIRKKYNYGKKAYKYIKKNPKSSFKGVPFLRSSYFANWRLLAKDPLHAFGFFSLKTGETLAVALAIACNRIKKL